MKEKRRKRIVIFALIIFIIVGAFIMVDRANTRLYRAVRSHVRVHGESVVTLGELLPFAWDQVVYIRWPASGSDVYEAIGVRTRGSGDMVVCIIFVRDGRVVHRETLHSAVNLSRPQWWPPWPWRMGNSIGIGFRDNATPLIHVFERDDLFGVGRREHEHGSSYWIRVVESSATY